VDQAFEHLQGVKFMGRRIRLDYANKAKSGPPSREEVLQRQQQVAMAAQQQKATMGGGGGGGGGMQQRQNAGPSAAAAAAAAAPPEDDNECPLCCEPLDKTDLSFVPCSCGYQVRTRPIDSSRPTCAACC
jgi:hypothetical protein